MRQFLKTLSVCALAWYFVNTWPGSMVNTVIGPFRSFSQCQLFRQGQAKQKVKTTNCAQDGETYGPIGPVGTPLPWYAIINGNSALSLPAGPFQDQAQCEAFKAAVSASGAQDGDGTSACWPL